MSTTKSPATVAKKAATKTAAPKKKRFAWLAQAANKMETLDSLFGGNYYRFFDTEQDALNDAATHIEDEVGDNVDDYEVIIIEVVSAVRGRAVGTSYKLVDRDDLLDP